MRVKNAFPRLFRVFAFKSRDLLLKSLIDRFFIESPATYFVPAHFQTVSNTDASLKRTVWQV